MCLEYSLKDFERLLIKNGFKLNRFSGDHAVYVHVTEGRHISIPTGRKDLNKMLTLRLIKEGKLKTG